MKVLAYFESLVGYHKACRQARKVFIKTHHPCRANHCRTVRRGREEIHRVTLPKLIESPNRRFGNHHRVQNELHQHIRIQRREPQRTTENDSLVPPDWMRRIETVFRQLATIDECPVCIW